MDNILVVDALF